MNYLDASDEQLIACVAQHDHEAFNTLYDRHAGQVLGVLYKIISDRNLAEEILQEVFWRVWNKAHLFDPAKAKFIVWLFSISRRLAIDVHRKQRLRPQPAQSEQTVLQMETAVSPLINVIDQVDINYNSTKVIQALNSLSAKQRVVIEMAYFQGKTRREIAEELNEPVGTIHTRARLALQYLRQSLLASLFLFWFCERIL